MRGIVFMRNGVPVLLREDMDIGPISDFDYIYETLGDKSASIVEIVEDYELTGMVMLQDLHSVSFWKNETEPVTAAEAILESMKKDPEALVKFMNNDDE